MAVLIYYSALKILHIEVHLRIKEELAPEGCVAMLVLCVHTVANATAKVRSPA